MKTLPNPDTFLTDWISRMSDKTNTDTLDAIARDLKHWADKLPYTHRAHAIAFSVRLGSALSNQGEGAVVSALEVFRIAGGDVECTPNPSAAVALDCLRDLRQCYDEQPEAEADRRDAEREFVDRCAGFRGQMVSGNDLAASAERLIAIRPDKECLSLNTVSFCLSQLIDVVDAAIKSGDWKVDGACDPHMALAFSRRAIAATQEQT